MAFVLLVLCPVLSAQTSSAPQLPPSEELKAAAQPLIAARSQPDDLTQADLLAYTVGVGRAGQACLRLEPNLEDWVKQPEELLSLGRLCVYGLQYQPAQQAVWRYLKLPAPSDRETAFLILAKAFLGLNDPFNAAIQIQTIEKEYPYDAQIHLAIEQDVQLGTLFGDQANAMVLNLCSDQLRNTLPLLDSGSSLQSKEGTITGSTLFADAVRCVDAARDLSDPSASEMLTDTLAHLEKILQLPQWQHTAEYAPMQAAYARTRMSGQPTPTAALSGRLLRTTQPIRPFTLPLDHGSVLLVPFTLWSPSVLSIVPELHATAPAQEIYLVTSWAANTGNSDEESKELLDSLRTTAKALPEHASVLILPDPVLQQFFADTFPAAVVLRGGQVEANLPLVGEAGKRMTIFALHLPPASAPVSTAQQGTAAPTASHKPATDR